MALIWAWGWEIGAGPELYSGDWSLESIDTSVTNTADTTYTDQPADGFGGGSFVLKTKRANHVSTPLLFPNGEQTKGAVTFTVFVPSSDSWTNDNNGFILVNGDGNTLFRVKPVGDSQADSDNLVLAARGNFGAMVSAVSSTAQISTDQWNTITVRWDAVATSPPTVYLYINGDLQGSGQSNGTTSAGSMIPSGIKFGTWNESTSGHTWYDHVYWHSDPDTDNFTKKLFIQGLKLTADVEDTTFARSDNDSQTNLFQNLTGSTNAVFITSSDYPPSALFDIQNLSDINAAFNPAIKAVGMIAMVSGSGDIDKAATILKSGGNTVTQSLQTITNQLEFVTSSFPNTDTAGSAWTLTTVNALQIGVFVTGSV